MFKKGDIVSYELDITLMYKIGNNTVTNKPTYIVLDTQWDYIQNHNLLLIGDDDIYQTPLGWKSENLFTKVEKEKKMKFTIGDTVRVIRKVEKQNGWVNNWTPAMDNLIGKIATITDSSEVFGYELDKGFYYPSTALELIGSKYTVATSSDLTGFTDNRGVKYQYLTFGKLTLTIGTHIFKNSNGDAKVKWAVTFKNPKDQFSKQMARETLSNREWKTLYVEAGYKRDDIVLKILCDIVYNFENVSFSYRPYILELLMDYSHTAYFTGNYK